MRWVLRLVATEDDARCRSTDLIEICRPEGVGEIADLGLTLPEAKQLLASIQRAVVSAQAVSHGLQRPCCSACSGKCHLKDWRGHHIATLFGGVTVPLPRFRCTACNRIETSVGWPSRCRSTPELDELQAHLSALMTYRVASGVLQHLLPIDAGRSPETLRNHTLRIGAQLGTAASDQPTTAAAVITVSVDSTFIRSREEGERHLEVRVGNVETASGGRQVFGAVAKADTDISTLIRQSLRSVAVYPCRRRYHDATLARLVPRRNADPARGADSRRVVDRPSRQDAGKASNRRRGRTSALAHLERQGEECQAQHRSGPQGHACLQG
jgi:hypothetical protein